MVAIGTPSLIQPAADTQVSKPSLYNSTMVRSSAVYRDSADGSFKLADADAVGLTDVYGIAITPGAVGEYGLIATDGEVELVGVTMVKGMIYCLGPTPGQLCRETDLTAGCEVVHVGTAVTTTRLRIKIEKTGIVL